MAAGLLAQAFFSPSLFWNSFGLVAVVAFDAGKTLAVRRSEPFSLCYPSLTVAHVQAHLFEREIWEQHQVEPVGHPWLQPVDVPVRSVFSGTE